MLTVKRLIAGSGDVVALHETLGEILRTFEDGTSLRGANHGYVLRAGISLQFVVDAFYKGILRTNDDHVDAFLNDELLDGLEVVSLHSHVFATVAGTSIAWGDIEFLTLTALSNFPSEGVLTSATT